MRHLFLLVAGLSVTLPASPADRGPTSWPGFRGPGARGVAEGPPTPAKWNVPKGENVLWTASVPGLGHSSPVVWGDSVFVTSAVREGSEAPLKVGLYGDIESADDDAPQRFVLLRQTRRQASWSGNAR
jgi:putative pyrroloquinoline-quinone-binding quinoprotein